MKHEKDHIEREGVLEREGKKSDSNGEADGLRYWWKEVKPFLIKIIWGNPYLRFMSLVFLSGLGLLSPTFLEWIFTQLLELDRSTKVNSTTTMGLQEKVALCLIAIGIFGHLLPRFSEFIRSHRSWRVRVLKNQLASLCDDIATAFEDATTRKPPGFMADEIKKACTLAEKLNGRTDHSVFAQSVFAALLNPRIDASGSTPLFGVRVSELRSFASALKAEKNEE